MGPLSDKRLLIVTGKGGVGKSTVAAALALALSQRGLKTLVCELNVEERVTALLGKPPAGPEVTEIADNLWAVDVRPAEAMREYGLMTLKFERIYTAVFENRWVQYFLRFIPSLQEMVMLGKILFHLREQEADGRWRFDRVVIDAPATGHAITFFSVPQVILDTVPAGPMSKEAAIMRDLLVDPAVTAAVLVSLPEELPVNETLELCAALKAKVKIHPATVVLNGVYPPRFEASDLAALEKGSPLELLAAAHRERELQSTRAAERLVEGTGLPLLEFPRLFGQDFGPGAIAQLAGLLAPLLEKGR